MITDDLVVAFEGAANAVAKEFRDVIAVRSAEASQAAKVAAEQQALAVIQNQVGGERGEAAAAAQSLQEALQGLVDALNAGSTTP